MQCSSAGRPYAGQLPLEDLASLGIFKLPPSSLVEKPKGLQGPQGGSEHF